MKNKVFFFSITILCYLLFGISQLAFSQKNDTLPVVSIKAYAFAEGESGINKQENIYHYSLVSSIINNCDTSIRFWIYNCSWPVDNWIIDNDSIHFDYKGCDANFP